MRDALLNIQGIILLGAIFGILAIFLGVCFSEVVRSWRIWRTKRNRRVMTVLALIAILVGGTKPPRLNITWDEGLHNNGSYIDTNDLRRVEIRWNYDSWIPNVATFTLKAVEANTVNPDPNIDRVFTIGSCPITNRAMSVMMETDATNYLFFAEQSFIPDAPVVTNGVYHIRCLGGNNVWVPMGLKIYGDGNAILPPQLPQGENYLIDLIQQGDNE